MPYPLTPYPFPLVGKRRALRWFDFLSEISLTLPRGR